MAILPCGTWTTTHSCDSSRATPMVHRASTSVPTAQDCGRAAWTTRWDRGISERDDSFSSTISAHRSFRLAIARQETGSPSEWRTRTLKCFTPPNQTNISFICMRVVCYRCDSRHVESGSFQRVKIICLMHGGRRTVRAYSSRRKPRLCSAATFRQTTSTSWRDRVIRKRQSTKSYISARITPTRMFNHSSRVHRHRIAIEVKHWNCKFIAKKKQRKNLTEGKKDWNISFTSRVCVKLKAEKNLKICRC